MGQMKNCTLNCPIDDLNCLCYLALILNARFNVVGIFLTFACSICYGFMYVRQHCRDSFPLDFVFFVDHLVTHSILFEHWIVILILYPSLSQQFSPFLYCLFCFRFVFVPIFTTKFTLLTNTFFLYTNVH